MITITPRQTDCPLDVSETYYNIQVFVLILGATMPVSQASTWDFHEISGNNN